MSDIIWDGITRGSTLHADACAIRHQLANAAKTYDWEETLAILSGNPDLINVSRPDGKSWFAPLHQASHGGAPVEVVRRMLDTGAWRTLRIADGQRPIDIASARRHSHLLKALEPTHKRDVPKSLLSILQRNFHDVIVERALIGRRT